MIDEYVVLFCFFAEIFFVNSSLLYLSILDWYVREERISQSLKLGAIIGIVAGLLFPSIILPLENESLVYIYTQLALAAFILSLMVLYPYISWIRKKIYSYFYVSVYVAYDVVIWFIFPLFYYGVLGLDVNQVLVANYMTGAVLGTLLATAILKEIRTREVILGGLPAITSAITIADFSSRALSDILWLRISVGKFYISFVHVFLIVSIVVQYIYYKRVIAE